MSAEVLPHPRRGVRLFLWFELDGEEINALILGQLRVGGREKLASRLDKRFGMTYCD